MYIVLVHCHVKPENLDAFKAIATENAQNSVQEPGVARFDVIQQADDPTRFVLVEVYRTQADNAAHRQTPHFAKWASIAYDLLSEPRTHVTYSNLFPDDGGWD